MNRYNNYSRSSASASYGGSYAPPRRLPAARHAAIGAAPRALYQTCGALLPSRQAPRPAAAVPHWPTYNAHNSKLVSWADLVESADSSEFCDFVRTWFPTPGAPLNPWLEAHFKQQMGAKYTYIDPATLPQQPTTSTSTTTQDTTSTTTSWRPTQSPSTSSRPQASTPTTTAAARRDQGIAASPTGRNAKPIRKPQQLYRPPQASRRRSQDDACSSSRAHRDQQPTALSQSATSNSNWKATCNKGGMLKVAAPLPATSAAPTKAQWLPPGLDNAISTARRQAVTAVYRN